MHALGHPQEAARWLRARVPGTLRCDSRKVETGDGFVAWPGAAVDGRQFVSKALALGATACLVEQEGLDAFNLPPEPCAAYPGLKAATGEIAAEFFDHPSSELALVAVTGTNGKTSTAWWLAQALSALDQELALPCGVIGTLGVGRPPEAGAQSGVGSMVSTGLTTPDPVLLQQTLRDFVQSGLKACAIEASSIGIEEHRLDGCRVRIAVLTNLTQDHLDYHGTMDAYWQAKRKLFAWPGLASAVVNVDDRHGAALAQELALQRVDLWTTSSQGAARLQARNIDYGAQGLTFEVVEEGAGVQTLASRMIGSYNISNLLGVVAAMRALGIPLASAVQACAALQPVPGRMECIVVPGQPLVAVDYAHTPDALGKALCALKPLAQQRGGRLWCVFGCGGDRDASKRPLMGAIAMQHAQQWVVTSDNPRSEKPESIIAQILLGLPQRLGVCVQSDRALAIDHAITTATACDVILLAGKGHEESQDIGGVKHPFSDRSHALQALHKRGAQQCEVTS